MNLIHTRNATVLLMSLAAAPSFAADAKTDGQWRGNGGAALSLSSGNTTASSLQLNADAQRSTSADKITLGGSVQNAKNKTGGVNQTTANKWAAAAQYDYNLSSQLFAFGKLGFESDKLVGLSLRSGVNAGLGYKVINTDALTFDLFGGLGYTTDKYSSAQLIDGKLGTSFSRANIYLGEASAHKLSATTSFTQKLELFPGLSGDKALLAKFNAGLSVAMSNAMSLNVGLQDNYNSQPAAGTKKNDLGLFTGINVKFRAL